MRELSLNEMNCIAGGVGLYATADLNGGVSDNILKTGAATAMTWYHSAALGKFIATNATFLGAAASPLAGALTFVGTYWAAPKVLGFVDQF